MFYGLGLAMIVEAQIGLPPWDVFAKGISIQLGTSYGIASVIVSALVLLAWIPLKVKPGIGSILNAILIGLWSDVFIPEIPEIAGYWGNLLPAITYAVDHNAAGAAAATVTTSGAAIPRGAGAVSAERIE